MAALLTGSRGAVPVICAFGDIHDHHIGGHVQTLKQKTTSFHPFANQISCPYKVIPVENSFLSFVSLHRIKKQAGNGPNRQPTSSKFRVKCYKYAKGLYCENFYLKITVPKDTRRDTRKPLFP